MCDERDRSLGREIDEGHTEERAGRRTQRLRPERVGAAGREREVGAERVAGAREGSDVAGIADSPELEPERRAPALGAAGAEDADHPRRVPERRDLGEQVRGDLFRARQPYLRRPRGVDEREVELPPARERTFDEVLALAGEQAELVALPPRLELAHELQPRVVARRD